MVNKSKEKNRTKSKRKAGVKDKKPSIRQLSKFGLSRDKLYNKLKKNNIFSRRYFYPLITDFPLA